jgi:hypothetical protein
MTHESTFRLRVWSRFWVAAAILTLCVACSDSSDKSDGKPEKPDGKSDYVWMTPEQERAVVEFVERGQYLMLKVDDWSGVYPD